MGGACDAGRFPLSRADVRSWGPRVLGTEDSQQLMSSFRTYTTMMTNHVVQTLTRFTYSLIKLCRIRGCMQGPRMVRQSIIPRLVKWLYLCSLSSFCLCIYLSLCVYIHVYIYISLSMSLSSPILLIWRSLRAFCSRMMTRSRSSCVYVSASICMDVCNMRVYTLYCLKYRFPRYTCFTVD